MICNNVINFTPNNEHRTMNKTFMLLLTFLFSLPFSHCYAQVPHLIRYQGQAVDENEIPLEGPYDLHFRLYDAQTGGSIVWEEPQSGVQLTGGHFSVLLGQVTPLDAMDWTEPCWLSLQVDTDPELTPRQRVTSVPIAIRSESAEQLDGPMTVYNDKIGIGTATPNRLLQVIQNTDDDYSPTDGVPNIVAEFRNNTSGAGNNSFIRLVTEINGEVYLGSVQNAANTDSDFVVKVKKYDGIAHKRIERMRITSDGYVGIGDSSPSNILTIAQGSSTDPIADDWTYHPSDRAHKTVIGSADPGYLDQIRDIEIYEWKKKPLVSDVEIERDFEKDEKRTPAAIEAKRAKLESKKTKLPKFKAKRVGMVIDDDNIPEEVLSFGEDGEASGVSLMGYVGYLHAALKEAVLKIDELESRLAAVENP